MKYFTVLLILLFAHTSFAEGLSDEYCKPDGAGGVEVCHTSTDALKISKGLAKGYVRVTYINDTYDRATENLISIVYDSTVSPITKTWNTTPKTQEELDEVESQAISFEMYIVLKWLKTPGAIICDSNLTDCHINVATAPQGLKDAYLARQALGQ